MVVGNSGNSQRFILPIHFFSFFALVSFTKGVFDRMFMMIIIIITSCLGFGCGVGFGCMLGLVQRAGCPLIISGLLI